jgi:hypothetical protein
MTLPPVPPENLIAPLISDNYENATLVSVFFVIFAIAFTFCLLPSQLQLFQCDMTKLAISLHMTGHTLPRIYSQ